MAAPWNGCPSDAAELAARNPSGIILSGGPKSVNETPAPLIDPAVYQPAWRLARSLELVATSWFHDGAWGIQREDDLVAGYAKWLADNGVLASADVWRGATTNEFVPDAAGRA